MHPNFAHLHAQIMHWNHYHNCSVASGNYEIDRDKEHEKPPLE